MQWIKNKFAAWIDSMVQHNRARSEAGALVPADSWRKGQELKIQLSSLKQAAQTSGPRYAPNSPDSGHSLHFKVWNAVGGKIVEFTRYDERMDRTEHQVYIIGADQDFGERISKIATLESLK